VVGVLWVANWAREREEILYVLAAVYELAAGYR
jgi:hypothetical protein